MQKFKGFTIKYVDKKIGGDYEIKHNKTGKKWLVRTFNNFGICNSKGYEGTYYGNISEDKIINSIKEELEHKNIWKLKEQLFKKEIEKLLNKFSKIDKSKIPHEIIDGSEVMDMEKFPEVPEIKELINTLKEKGVDGKWLFKNGFAIVGLVLGKFL
jgi:tRNA G26 N,N-dimethylase Trm1